VYLYSKDAKEGGYWLIISDTLVHVNMFQLIFITTLIFL